jgi:cobalt-zinc-cadmium efflux system outer membrane protein
MLRWSLTVVLLSVLVRPAPANEPLTLTAPEAMARALRDNPELAVQRQRLGIAAADIVIARSLPMNPQWQGEFRGAAGPPSAGITSHFTTFHALLFTLQPHGARQMREQAAAAGLSRVEAEIAHQETRLALAVYRAVHEVVYRQERIALAERLVQTTETTSEQFNKLAKVIRIAELDKLLLRTDVADAKAQVQTARQAHITAGQELRRLLGMTAGTLRLSASLAPAPLAWRAEELQTLALERRPDLQARRAAVAEAEARLRLERANRFGNPQLGPSYEFNETQVNFIGAQFAVPIPWNRKRGEILQREAELTKALLEARQSEVEIQIEVQSALEQWRQAEAEVALYEQELLPAIRGALAEADKFVRAGQPDADLAKLLEFHRRLARAEEGYLNARWNRIAARAQLAAAVGDAGLAVAEIQRGERLP